MLLSDALPAWLSSPFSPSSSSSVTVPPLIGCRSLSFLEDEPYKREISFWRKNILLGILSLSVLCRSYSFFPTFYGTWMFITAFKRPCHLAYPELARSSPYPHIPLPEDPSYYYPPIYAWVFQEVPSLRFPHQNPVYASPIPHTCYMPRSSHSYRF